MIFSRRFLKFKSRSTFMVLRDEFSIQPRMRFLNSNFENSVGYVPWCSSEIVTPGELSKFAYLVYDFNNVSHPLISLGKDMLSLQSKNSHNPGFLLMLSLKLVFDKDFEKNLKNNQLLSRSTDLIHFAFLIHNTLEKSPLKDCDENLSEEVSIICTKLAVLFGDLLFSKACYFLSQTDIPRVVNIMSRAIAKLSLNYSSFPASSNQFLKDETKTEKPLEDFLSYINWIFVDLLESAFYAAHFIMYKNELSNTGYVAILRLLSESLILHHELNILSPLLEANNQKDCLFISNCGENKSKLIKFYPRYTPIIQIFEESKEAYEKKVSMLFQASSQLHLSTPSQLMLSNLLKN